VRLCLAIHASAIGGYLAYLHPSLCVRLLGARLLALLRSWLRPTSSPDAYRVIWQWCIHCGRAITPRTARSLLLTRLLVSDFLLPRLLFPSVSVITSCVKPRTNQEREVTPRMRPQHERWALSCTSLRKHAPLVAHALRHRVC